MELSTHQNERVVKAFEDTMKATERMALALTKLLEDLRPFAAAVAEEYRKELARGKK